MARSYEVLTLEGLAALKNLEQLPREIQQAAYRAVNAAAENARTRSAKEIRNQVNFTAAYLSPAQGRLRVGKKANAGTLESNILARNRATSLARFATSGAQNKEGVTVQVKPGSARFLRRAFLIRLRKGTQLTETQNNLGLAIRLPPGTRIDNKRQMVQVKGNLYLLYGPSVGQVFNTVRDDVAPAVLDFLEDEFLRLLDVTRRG